MQQTTTGGFTAQPHDGRDGQMGCRRPLAAAFGCRPFNRFCQVDGCIAAAGNKKITAVFQKSFGGGCRLLLPGNGPGKKYQLWHLLRSACQGADRDRFPLMYVYSLLPPGSSPYFFCLSVYDSGGGGGFSRAAGSSGSACGGGFAPPGTSSPSGSSSSPGASSPSGGCGAPSMATVRLTCGESAL